MTDDIMRTPEERFAALPGWPYTPCYFDDLAGYDGLRLHFIDTGAKDAAATFLCLHGEPTWAYLYRRMIPVFLQSGARVVAPDFFGFGRSDKPSADAGYTWDFHRNSLIRLVERLDLRNITLVVQDWGGLLGLTLPIAFPERIARLLIMNTAFATGVTPTQGFLDWRDYVARTPDLKVGALIRRGTPHLSDAETAAYDAPFPDHRYKAGVRRFPQLVPITASMDGVAVSRAALAWWKNSFAGASFMAIGMRDPVLGAPVMHAIGKMIRGCPPPMEITDGGHFVQEWGEPIARAALRAWGEPA